MAAHLLKIEFPTIPFGPCVYITTKRRRCFRGNCVSILADDMTATLYFVRALALCLIGLEQRQNVVADDSASCRRLIDHLTNKESSPGIESSLDSQKATCPVSLRSSVGRFCVLAFVSVALIHRLPSLTCQNQKPYLLLSMLKRAAQRHTILKFRLCRGSGFIL